MIFRSMLSGLVRALKWGFIVLGVIYGVLWAINARDETPSPEFIAIQTLPKIDADPNNGYLALLGLTAPADEDMFDYGVQWVDTYSVADTDMALKRADVSFISGKLRVANIKFQGDREALCNPAKMPCVSQARSSAATWRKLAEDNPILLERERRLVGYTHYEESYFPPNNLESPIPAFVNPSRLLTLDLVALDAAEGRLEAALAALEPRIAFDRRALLGSHGLINALVAVSWLKQDYALLAEIVGGRSTALVSYKPNLLRMTEPLTLDQMRTVALRMYAGESRHRVNLFSHAFLPTMASMMGEPVKESAWEGIRKTLLSPLHQAQATQNLVAHLQAAYLQRLNDFAPETAGVWVERDAQTMRRAAESEVFSWRVLYNPLGKLNVYGEAQNFRDSYTVRVSDIIGVSRLVRLQVEMVTEGVADAEIASRLSANKELYDVYTGKPMGVYAGERTLYFDTHRDGKPERITVGI